MNLYFSPGSPYARIVRIALMEKHLTAQITERQVDPWSDDDDLGAHNPMMRVPTLVTEDGACLTESLLIVHYLEDRFPETRLVPPERREETLALAGLGMGLIDSGVQTFQIRRFLSTGDSPGKLELRRLAALRRGLSALDSRVPAAAGEVVDLGCITVGTALAWLAFRIPDLEWAAEYPALASWLADLNLRPSFRMTTPE